MKLKREILQESFHRGVTSSTLGGHDPSRLKTSLMSRDAADAGLSHSDL